MEKFKIAVPELDKKKKKEKKEMTEEEKKKERRIMAGLERPPDHILRHPNDAVKDGARPVRPVYKPPKD